MRKHPFQNVPSRPFYLKAVARRLVGKGSERERASTLRGFLRSSQLRVDTLVLVFLVVTSSHGAAGQPREVCVSYSFAVIEWAPCTAVSRSRFWYCWWMLNSVSAICVVGVLDARSNPRGIHVCIYV